MTLTKRHFTLIELLVVMGLITLLVGLAVPTFLGLAKGKTTPIAAEEVKRQLEEAQAIAIGNRCYVGLIIPNGSDTYYGSAFTTDDTPDFSKSSANQYYLASTRPALLFKDGSNYYFDKWAPGSSWSKPLENARIVEVPQNVARNYDTVIPKDGDAKNWNMTTRSELTAPLAKIKTRSATLSHCAVVFAPDGGLDSTSDMFIFVSGCSQNGTELKFADDNTDYYILHINRINGKIAYFTRPQ